MALGTGALSRDPSRDWKRVCGEHPLPGKGSFAAGRALREFLESLGRAGTRKLDVYLSGGASSLAWLPRKGLRPGELRAVLQKLYARPLPIDRLNARRARLCQLKGGGSARWLGQVAPRTRARVFVLSDVAPSGPEIVGSGPFWDGKIPHWVVADNAAWIRALAREARKRKSAVLSARSGQGGPWQEWARSLDREIAEALERGRPGLILRGGEPVVDLRENKRGRGGRQSQLAAALLSRWAPSIARGELEILCLSSDGVDGSSGAAGAWLRASVAQRAMAVAPEGLARAVRDLDSARVLGEWGALVPSRPTGSNVQDAVIVRIRPGGGRAKPARARSRRSS